ncbi:PHD finger protein 3 isoform 2-T2 [Polymixia lowei]
MDIVDTFNHLIPSDQLDDSLLIGQNLECEASNEFGTGLQLEDSLKNMLSDKDPMFGSASSQFNPLDNDDANFLIAGSTEPSAGQRSTNTSTIAKPRGRPRRKPADRQQKSFLIEKGVRGLQLKKELALGGRININDVDDVLWLNPVVVLRRLTVTVGGFRIELLPGPSYTENTDTGQSVCFEDSFSYRGDIEYAMLQDDKVNVQNPTAENLSELGVGEKCCAEDVPLGLGPYVNPNDVQAANGTLMGSPGSTETKPDNQSVPERHKPVSKGKEAIKQPQNVHNNKTSSINKVDSKEKQKMLAKNLLKSKQGLTSLKNKSLVSCRPSSLIKGPKVPQNVPSKLAHRGDVHNMKSLKEKKGIACLKRHGETAQTEHASKVQRMQVGGPKSKVPGTSGPVGKRTTSSDSRLGEQQGLTKPTHSPVTPKPESASVTLGTPGHSSKTLDEGGQDKPKVKKPEKMLQKQKSRNARSITVDEPQLFIPDNAPAAKKEAEEQPANSETVWDGSNNCGLCKKHHNNTFMVGCGRCDDWFHGDCVGLDLTKVREMEEEDQMYVCLKCCAEESVKVEPDTQSAAKPEEQAKHEVQDNKLPPKPKQGPSQSLTSGGVRPVRKDSDRRQSTEVKDAVQKIGVQPKQETKSRSSSSAPKKPVSVEEIRRSVRDSLKEILLQRLRDSDLKVTLEKASDVAKKTERELFHLYKDTDSKYKSKYRSLMFNLKDTKNNVLFKRVLKGEISPGNLIRMSPEELASKELAAWRQRENRHTIEMIEKEQREVERRPITKITHKGEIEIESEEPVKAPEAVLEPDPKVTEESVEPLPLEQKSEGAKTEKDTTSQHKSHLFDLHCKICTGRMAPPVEEAPTKVVKVATTVLRRQSTTVEETKSTAPPGKDDDLHLTVLEESFRSAKSISYEGRSEYTTGRDDEAVFLSNLTPLWRGFVNMPAVAKLVTKAFPVSGVLDNLTEDLPDSIQVGGRISPQIVWDYFDKIRATGTKEVCLIRFSPETEEDEISYTLLHAYFSSRKRFGVVSNNLKQVKDMYLIPLGAAEKVPHQLVPFDGPGLENNRSNLLLGLIIRQRPKRDFLPVDVIETARIIPDSKPLAVSTNDVRAIEEDEKFFLSSLTTAKTKETDKLLNTTKDVDEPITEAFEEVSAAEEGNNQESNKPLRFLPGVLVGWGGELPPLPDVGGKPVAAAADDIQRTQVPPKANAATPGNATKSPTSATRLDRFVIKKKEPKPVKAEPELSSLTDKSVANSLLGKDVAKEVATHGISVSLKDKPPDVSTEAFLASLSTAPSANEASTTVSSDKGDVSLLSEKGNPEGTSSLLSKSQAASDPTNSSKPPLSGILKKSSAYSIVSNEIKMEVANKAKASDLLPLNPQPVPVLSSTRNDPIPASQHGYSHLSQAKYGPGEEIPSNNSSCYSDVEDPNMSQAGPTATPTPTAYPPSVQGPQAASYAPAHNDAPEFQYESMAPAIPTYSKAAPVPPQQQQPQVPGSYGYPSGPAPDEFSAPHILDQNHATPWAQDGPMAPQAAPGLPLQYVDKAKDYKRPEDRYSDPWERPRHAEDREHYGRHGDSHHGKKSRHHERERGKKHERSHEEKYKERTRHHSHSEDRHADRRKEKHRGDDHGNRYKDRHRHRRDSDYENGRRSSKDGYS